MKSIVRTDGTVQSAALGPTPAHTASANTAHEGETRNAVVRLLLEEGPITATEIGTRLGLSAAGVRRHLDALMDSGEARSTAGLVRQQRGRGRPAKYFQLTAEGRGRLGHNYDDLAGAAMRHIRKLGGNAAVEAFAHQRIQAIVADVEPALSASRHDIEDAAGRIADALSVAGFAASTRKVGNGVQICQHHCPVSHVAAEFPELCDAERSIFSELLGTHVQRLATIANGDCACTTHVPLPTKLSMHSPASTERTNLRKEHA